MNNIKYYRIGFGWATQNIYKLVRTHWYIYMKDTRQWEPSWAPGRHNRTEITEVDAFEQLL